MNILDTSLSVIIAVYNRKDELSELLTSLSEQSDKDFEVIVVDDGSLEDLASVISWFENKLSIQYVKKENSGAGLSRNQGAKMARNTWLIFLDSDVVVPKDYILNVKKNLIENPADAFGGADKANANFSHLQRAISYSMTSILTTGGIRGNKKSINKFQPRSFNMGVRKDIFLEVGGFSEMRIGEDPDLSMTLWERCYKTLFYENIAVYHKRRTDLMKFSKQVYNFGVARPILNQRHPQYNKITFWLPSLFVIGWFIGLLSEVVLGFNWMIMAYAIYLIIIFLHSSILNKSWYVGILSTITTIVQMFSYGIGFVYSWLSINILKKAPKEAFPSHFYS